jgi:RNA polymerase sigma-70 factor (ECF subfamily)
VRKTLKLTIPEGMSLRNTEGNCVTLNGTTAQHYLAVDPDVRLMLDVRDDNAAAFEELVLRYQDRLINVLEHIVRNHQLAEDLAQDVFIRVFRARKTYEPGAKFSTWLYTIANNVASNALRNRARRKEVGEGATGNTASTAMPLAEMAQAKSSFMPARRLDKLEMAEVVRMAMDTLSERQRMALVLCKFEGMSYQEIAESMGLTEKAIKSLLSRARVNLRAVLEPYIAVGERPVAVNSGATTPAAKKTESKTEKQLDKKPLPVAKRIEPPDSKKS